VTNMTHTFLLFCLGKLFLSHFYTKISETPQQSL
jgi:hypothetical protein